MSHSQGIHLHAICRRKSELYILLPHCKLTDYTHNLFGIATLFYLQAGIREGIMAGTQATLQEGFNCGYKDSFFIAHNLGKVRGVLRYINSWTHALGGIILSFY